jgi:hypothetical protein
MKRPIIWHDLCPKFGGPMHLEIEDEFLEKERNYKYLETIIKDALTKGI